MIAQHKKLRKYQHWITYGGSTRQQVVCTWKAPLSLVDIPHHGQRVMDGGQALLSISVRVLKIISYRGPWRESAFIFLNCFLSFAETMLATSFLHQYGQQIFSYCADSFLGKYIEIKEGLIKWCYIKAKTQRA